MEMKLLLWMRITRWWLWNSTSSENTSCLRHYDEDDFRKTENRNQNAIPFCHSHIMHNAHAMVSFSFLLWMWLFYYPNVNCFLFILHCVFYNIWRYLFIYCSSKHLTLAELWVSIDFRFMWNVNLHISFSPFPFWRIKC